MPFLDTPSGILHYREVGHGTPLVLLHANPGDSRDFDAVMPALAERYRVLALDWPGFGQSQAPAEPWRLCVLDFYVALKAFIDGLKLATALFIGNSVGGNAAARLAAEQPDRVRALILVAPGGFTPHNLMTRSFCALQGSRFALSPRRFAGLYLKRLTPTTEAMLQRAATEHASGPRLAISRALWRGFAQPENDLRSLATYIQAPTLLLFGAQDIAIPARRDGQAAQQSIPHAQIAILPCGHAPFAELPAAFLDVAQPFLYQHNGGTPTSA